MPGDFLTILSSNVSKPFDVSNIIKLFPEAFLRIVKPFVDILNDLSPLDIKRILEEYGMPWK